MAKLTRKQAARRYLQADMNASYTGLPEEAREIHEETKRRLVRSSGQELPLLATVGTDRDFDAPLTPGEREHQRYMRTSKLADSSPQAIAEHRARLRNPPVPRGPRRRSPGPATRRASSSRSRAAPRRAASTATSAVSDAVAGRGNIFLQLLGWTLALSLVYLLVAGKGVNALGGIMNTIVGGVRTFITPADPIKSLEQALGATPPTSSSSTATAAAAAAGGVATGASATGEPSAAEKAAYTKNLGSVLAGASAPKIAAAKTDSWGLPPSLLKADLSLRRAAAAAVAAGTETAKQAATAEERLIPRAKYPSFYAHQG